MDLLLPLFGMGSHDRPRLFHRALADWLVSPGLSGGYHVSRTAGNYTAGVALLQVRARACVAD